MNPDLQRKYWKFGVVKVQNNKTKRVFGEFAEGIEGKQILPHLNGQGFQKVAIFADSQQFLFEITLHHF